MQRNQRQVEWQDQSDEYRCFGCDGVLRPRRTHAFAEGVVNKAIRFRAPAELIAAAKSAEQKVVQADRETKCGSWGWYG